MVGALAILLTPIFRSRLVVRVLHGRTGEPADGLRLQDTLFSFEGASPPLDLENSIASASIYSQVTKGLRWMPWRQEPMKDASGCEKSRGAA